MSLKNFCFPQPSSSWEEVRNVLEVGVDEGCRRIIRSEGGQVKAGDRSGDQQSGTSLMQIKIAQNRSCEGKCVHFNTKKDEDGGGGGEYVETTNRPTTTLFLFSDPPF